MILEDAGVGCEGNAALSLNGATQVIWISLLRLATAAKLGKPKSLQICTLSRELVGRDVIAVSVIAVEAPVEEVTGYAVDLKVPTSTCKA